MDDYVSEEWADILELNGWDSFESVWGLQADWFEPPNERRGGWSGVARVELKTREGDVRVVFLKRQENHTRRAIRHPFYGECTFSAEIRNILNLQKNGIPTLRPVYFSQRNIKGNRQAILATEEMFGYESLDEAVPYPQRKNSVPGPVGKRQLIISVSQVVAKLHANRYVHNSLHPKHVFVRLEDASARLIDLEKMRRVLFTRQAMHRDLDSLNRRSRDWSRTDRLRFLLSYLGEESVTPPVKESWNYFSNRYQAAQRKKVANDTR